MNPHEMAAGGHRETQSGRVWIGKRVVPASGEFALEPEDGQPAEWTESVVYIYGVERTRGAMLWLKAEGPSPTTPKRSDWLPRTHSLTSTVVMTGA